MRSKPLIRQPGKPAPFANGGPLRVSRVKMHGYRFYGWLPEYFIDMFVASSLVILIGHAH